MTTDVSGERPHSAANPPKAIMPPKARSVSRILKADELTPFELEHLQKTYGYDGVSEVPTDLADRLKATAMPRASMEDALRAASNAMPPGFEMPTRDLDINKIETVEDDGTAAAMLDRYSDVVGSYQKAQQRSPQPSKQAAADSAFEAARKSGVEDIRAQRDAAGIHPDVARALKDIDEESVDKVKLPGGAPDKPAASPKGAEPAKDKDKDLTPEERAERRRKFLDENTTEEGRDAYRNAVLSFSQYSRSYELFNGKLRITFRDIGEVEQAMIIRQQAIDIAKGRVEAGDYASMLHLQNRYTMVCMLQKVVNTDTRKGPVDIHDDVSIGENLALYERSKLPFDGFDADDTDVFVWYRFLTTQVLRGSLYACVMNKYQDFSQELTFLQIAAQSSEFFTPPTQ